MRRLWAIQRRAHVHTLLLDEGDADAHGMPSTEVVDAEEGKGISTTTIGYMLSDEDVAAIAAGGVLELLIGVDTVPPHLMRVVPVAELSKPEGSDTSITEEKQENDDAHD